MAKGAAVGYPMVNVRDAPLDGKFHPVEFSSVRHRRQCTVCAVDVEPCPVALRDLSDLPKGINGAGADRAG